MKTKKIAYITGTRADSGLMTSVLKSIEKSNFLKLQVYATGMHLMSQFGYSFSLVKRNFPNVRILNTAFKKDSRASVVEFMSNLLNKINQAFEEDRPDFVLTLGDRPEMLCVATACLYLGIPTGQLHAGDKTFTVDESARHAITKMSHLFFPATQNAAKRIEKMGEERWRIHVVGAPGLDFIKNKKLPTRKKLFEYLDLDYQGDFILITQHPISENVNDADYQMNEILKAVKKTKLPAVIIYPNADPGGRKMIKCLRKEKTSNQFKIFPNIDYEYFLSLEKEAVLWIGNSSAGMIESSSFKIPVINVGIRQLGREHGENVLSVGNSEKEISMAIKKALFDSNFLTGLKKIKNPWGDGKTGEKVAKLLEDLVINERLLTKQIVY